MFGDAELQLRSDYDTLEKNWEDMAKVLNYCVGPTKKRLSDFKPTISEDYGGAFCVCGERITRFSSFYRKAGATPEIEQTCWKTKGYTTNNMNIGWGPEDIDMGGE